jgi:hypothetical protein
MYRKNLHDAGNYKYAVIKASTNIKLGNKVTKGHLKGARIFTLTLEERATCDSECEHWLDCYGNNMPFGHRFKANDALMVSIERDLDKLDAKGKPYLVRLHILGDFFSVEYILFWRRQLAKREYLNVYGYTRNHPTKPLGYALQLVREQYGKRFAVRFSNYPDDPFSAQSEHVSTGGVGCPVQMNRTNSCGTCTLCWEMEDKSIIFYDH